MSPDDLVAHCIEAGTHLTATRRYISEPFDRCHGCSQPVIVDPKPGWRDQGLCLTADPDVFFPDKGEPGDPAKAICDRCPVINECGAHGILHESIGIWGGLSAPEVAAARRRLGITLSTPGTRADVQAARRRRVLELDGIGWTTVEIAREVDLTRDQVSRILHQHAGEAA